MEMKIKMEKKLEAALEAIRNTKGENTLIYDFTAVNPFIDRVVITSASNMRQVFAIAINIRDKCKEKEIAVKIEGNQDSRWVLVNIDTVIVHVFLDEEREIYHLERLYSDLPRVEGYDL